MPSSGLLGYCTHMVPRHIRRWKTQRHEDLLIIWCFQLKWIKSTVMTESFPTHQLCMQEACMEQHTHIHTQKVNQDMPLKLCKPQVKFLLVGSGSPDYPQSSKNSIPGNFLPTLLRKMVGGDSRAIERRKHTSVELHNSSKIILWRKLTISDKRPGDGYSAQLPGRKWWVSSESRVIRSDINPS